LRTTQHPSRQLTAGLQLPTEIVIAIKGSQPGMKA